MEDIGWVLIRTKNLRYVRNMRKLTTIYQRSTIFSYKHWCCRLSPQHKYPEIAEGLVNVGQQFKNEQWILIPLNTLDQIRVEYLKKLLKHGVIVSNDKTRQMIHSSTEWKQLSAFFKEYSL